MSAPTGSSSSWGWSASSSSVSSVSADSSTWSSSSSCAASLLDASSVMPGSSGSSASTATRASAAGASSGAAEAATTFRRRRGGTGSAAGAAGACCTPGSSRPEVVTVSDLSAEPGCSATGACAGAAAAAVTLRRRRGAGELTASPSPCSKDSVDSDVVRRAMGLALSGADAVAVPSTRQRGCAPRGSSEKVLSAPGRTHALPLIHTDRARSGAAQAAQGPRTGSVGRRGSGYWYEAPDAGSKYPTQTQISACATRGAPNLCAR